MFGKITNRLSPQEKKAFYLHFTYSVIEGIILGVVVLNEFVFIKSLKGTNFQLSVLFMFSMAIFAPLILFNEYLNYSKNKKKLLRVTALVTRIPLFALFFFPHSAAGLVNTALYHYIFLAVFFMYYLATPVLYPTINLLLKHNYKPENFGKLYSYSSSANKVVMMVVTAVYGGILDYNPFVFVYVFPVVAVLGISSIFLLSKIEFPKVAEIPVVSFFKTIKNSIVNLSKILIKNKAYRDFELGFMFYGVTFMISVSVISIFLSKHLGLNYSSIAFYKNSYNIIAIITLPFFGKLIGKINLHKFATITYAAFMLYLVFMWLADFVPAHFNLFGIKIYYSLVLSYIFYSVYAATMALLWYIGSSFFCKKEEAGDYQSVHLSMVGLRGLFSPIIGIVFYEWLGFAGVFIISISLMVLGLLFSVKHFSK